MADSSLGRDDGRGVDDNGNDVSVVVVRESQKEKARLGGDGDADLVGELQAAAPFPRFFGDKDLDEGAKVDLFGSVEHAVVNDITAHDLFPLRGEGCFGEFFPAMIGKPVKHRDSLSF